GEFRNPSKINICYKNNENKFCPCENECKQCSSRTGSEKIVRAVVLEDELEIFRTKSTNIVFYLSINISLENQNILSDIVEKLIHILKTWFKRSRIDVIKYSTTNRQELIKNADLIVYVSATQQEIKDIEENSLKIGQNCFHDEFNQIHFLTSERSKCIDIAILSDHASEIKNVRRRKREKNRYKHKSLSLLFVLMMYVVNKKT
ncbi:hypothetical protein BpHYR1_028931, partial [Brachionus plicatilis]